MKIGKEHWTKMVKVGVKLVGKTSLGLEMVGNFVVPKEWEPWSIMLIAEQKLVICCCQ